MNWNEKFARLMEMEMFLHYTRAKELISKERKQKKEPKEAPTNE